MTSDSNFWPRVTSLHRYGIATEVGHGVNGSLPDVVPFMRYGGRPADVSWSAAMITLLHVGWKEYGDLRTYRSMGDANLSGESMALNFDMSAFFSWFLLFVISRPR